MTDCDTRLTKTCVVANAQVNELKVTCSWAGCDARIKVKDLKAHEAECKHRMHGTSFNINVLCLHHP